jgi:hypothetical protein
MGAASENFYRDLPDFRDFDAFGELERYAPVPDDWVAMVSDVRGSTAAIAKGRYKSVNMAGAASIIAVLNAAGEEELPFVFGGDGGAVLVPPSVAGPARAALRRLQAHSEAALVLSLRAAAIPVARLRAEGAEIRVRKYRLGKGNHLAMFAGRGLVRADEILKAEAAGDPDILRADPEAGPPDMEGLSCRWAPIRPARGRIITLMIAAADPAEEQAVLRDALAGLNRILTGGLRRFAPVRAEEMRFRWPPLGLAMEARLGRGKFLRTLAWAAFTSFNQWLCETFRIRIADYDGRKYRDELVAYTDFRKYDGVFRAVLNVTEAQAAEIEAYLEAEHQKGRVIWGAHLSDEALMTCLLFDLAHSRHVHFVDGADGGFAIAAKGFKLRAKALQEGRSPSG